MPEILHNYVFENVVFGDVLHNLFKTFLQTSNFSNLNYESMINIQQFNSMMRVYNKMTNYHSGN